MTSPMTIAAVALAAAIAIVLTALSASEPLRKPAQRHHLDASCTAPDQIKALPGPWAWCRVGAVNRGRLA